MPLITCPDCSSPVSDSAPSCPKCGRPLAAMTIERTGKSIKGIQALGCLSFPVGVFCLLAGMSSDGGQVVATLGILLMFAGGGGFIWASVMKWWRHD